MNTGKLIAKVLEVIDGPICMHVEIDRTCMNCMEFFKKNYPGLYRSLAYICSKRLMR